MPKPVDQPKEAGDIPRLNDATSARKKLRCGHNKWNDIQHAIDHVKIGGRKFWTDEALAAYVRRQTRKGRVPGRPDLRAAGAP